MALSDETLRERYGGLPRLECIEKMIEDCVDTPIIMEQVRYYGSQQFAKGQVDERSRAANKPGDGDMGG